METPERTAVEELVDHTAEQREREVRDLRRFEARIKAREIRLRAVDPYGGRSEHSWVRDMVMRAAPGVDPLAEERLDRSAAAAEERGRDPIAWAADRLNREQPRHVHGGVEARAVSSTTLGGLIPATLPPELIEQIAFGLRSSAPLATTLLRLDPPEVGTSAQWAKTTTAATVGNQTAENTAVPTSADPVAASATDPLRTIAGELPFSVQTMERGGAQFDRYMGFELGYAYGARLEQQIWAGTGASGQLTGLTVMTGNSSSTVSGQTQALVWNKCMDQLQQVSVNLGSQPDILALASRRHAHLFANIPAPNIPPGLTLVPSPAAPTNLGGGTEDWLALINRPALPLVCDEDPSIEVQQEGPSAGTTLTFRFVIYNYVALGVSRSPAGVGLVKGATPPVFT
jgi:HK97 family phage major capsid protein